MTPTPLGRPLLEAAHKKPKRISLPYSHETAFKLYIRVAISTLVIGMNNWAMLTRFVLHFSFFSVRVHKSIPKQKCMPYFMLV